MKTIIFSDTHITHRYNEERGRAFKELINPFEKVIINGDFIDKYFTDYAKLMISGWKDFFNLLSEKDAIYILGNHDSEDYAFNVLRPYFQEITRVYNLKIGKWQIHIEHGDRIAPTLDVYSPEIFGNRYMVAVGNLMTDITTKVYPDFFRSSNRKMKKWGRKNLSEEEILICGHSHLADFSLEERFVNTGVSKFDYIQYLMVTDSKLELNSKHF